MKTSDTPDKLTLSEPSEPLIHELEDSKRKVTKKTVLISVGIIVMGIISGYFLTTITAGKNAGSSLTSGNTSTGKVVSGSSDNKVFKDSTEGILESGGINGEGTHKLIRPGGESQTVYLTSSVLDLSQFVGKKVKVWGETFAAQKAAWLMDVGKVEIL